MSYGIKEEHTQDGVKQNESKLADSASSSLENSNKVHRADSI